MQKPLVSILITSYNQKDYILEAIESAINQTYDNLEIVISDDCSTDGSVELINQYISNYKGKKEIRFNVNSTNLGIRDNFMKLFYELSKGDIVLINGGDDVSMPNRAQIYVDYFERFPEIMSISCLSLETNEKLEPLASGREWHGQFSIYTLDDYTFNHDLIVYSGDSRGIRRRVIDEFPPSQFSESEDSCFFIRSLLLGPGCFLRTPLVKHRHHGNNATDYITTKESLRGRIKQMYMDIDIAYKKGYITKLQKSNIENKVTYCARCMYIYKDDNRFKSLECIVYRVLRKIFHVKLNYNDFPI